MQRPVTGLAVLLLLSAASAAQGALQFGSDERSGSAGRRQPALPPAGLEVEGKAAAASTALDAGAAAVDPIIAGHDCVYTPAVFPEYDDAEKLKAAVPLASCRQPGVLTYPQQQACMRCLAQRTREGCLAQNANTYYGADHESCTWVGKERVKEVKYALGVNVPWTHAMWLAEDTCSLRLEFSVDRPSRTFSAAFMQGWLSGWDRQGVEIPRGLQSEVLCVMKNQQTSCNQVLQRPRHTSFAVFSRNVWTYSRAIIDKLKETGDACIATPDGVCSSSDTKFNYTMRVTEVKCAPGRQPGPAGITTGQLPVAQPGVILYPGGETYSVYRELWFYLEGARQVSYTIQSPRPMLVAVLTPEDTDAACTKNSKETYWTCDYRAVKKKAVPGTFCIGTSCGYGFLKDPADRLNLVITYPRVFTIPITRPGALNADETPTQLVDVTLRVYPK